MLASFQRSDSRSAEAGRKYFVLGALASGILLYGISLLYGFTGTTSFEGVATAFGAEGLSRGEAHEFAPAMQSELTRLLTEEHSPSTFAADRKAPLLHAGVIAPSAGPRPRALGEQVADSVYRGLAGTQTRGGPRHER